MKRLLFRSLFVLCLIAAFSLASCNRMEENPDNAQEIQQPAGIAFTATLAPKGENPQTKAISSGIDDNGKEILNVAWAVDEKIVLYYQISGGYAKATAKVTDVNDGVATISASLDATTIDGGTVQFVYPASLANDKGDDIDESKLMTQYGKLDGIANSISKRFDAATGEGKIKLSGGTSLPTTATVTDKTGTGSVSLQNRVCICKFHLTVYTVGVNGTLVSLKEMNDDLTIRDGNGHTYTIKSTKEWPGEAPAGATGNPGYGTGDDIYVAMLPITEKPLILSATYNDKNYNLTTQPGTLAAGKFYRNVPVAMCIDPLTLTGEITNTLTIPAGMTITVNNANFNIPDNLPAIKLEDKASLILTGTNTVQSLYAPAIQCEGKANIVINDISTVSAVGSYPAIMCDGDADITINDASTIEAIQCTGDANISVNGSTITSNGVTPAINCGGNTTIELNGDNTITAATSGQKAVIIADGKSLNITGDGSAALNGNIGVPASASLKFNGTAASHDIYIPDVTTLSAGGITVGSTITIADGATFTLSWTTLNVTSGPGIQCSGNATLILDGTNYITTTAEGFPAILPGGSGTALTIRGSGSVTATGGQYAAGIGSGCFTTHITTVYTCGNIIIESGTITAKGGEYGAGIGCGYNGICGNITISGGTVTANGGEDGAGIGSGSGYDSTGAFNGICGDITICGGTIIANAKGYGAGIGSGFYGKFASINITDGISSIRATARSSSYAEPIGKGYDDNGSGSVTVDGVTDWSGTATEHLNFSVSSITHYNDTWTLTHK